MTAALPARVGDDPTATTRTPLFAGAYDATGSHTAILLASTALPLGVCVAALLARLPARAARPATV